MPLPPRLTFAGIVLTAIATILSATPVSQAAWETPPGWTETRGGAGGKVIRVTTLAASGPGSLAEAFATEGPRTIEFAVGGAIDLGGHSLKIAQPFVTIAGETAPSPGITLTHGGMGIRTHDVIVRHIRIRPGAGTRARRSGWEVDGLATGGGARDVIVDHCSLTWATDENLSASGPRFQGATADEWRRNTSHRITFSHCIVGEGLHDSTHAKGGHSMGSLIHDNATDIAIIGNLYISNNDRNPLFKGGARGAVINNLIHNPGIRVIQLGSVPSQWENRELQRAIMVVAGNVAQKGPSSAQELAFFEVWPSDAGAGAGDVFFHDNQFLDREGSRLPATPAFRREQALTGTNPGKAFRIIETRPFWPPRLQARPADQTKAWVLANAGARPWDRDATDRRLVEEARTGGGRIIDHESGAGPGPTP